MKFKSGQSIGGSLEQKLDSALEKFRLILSEQLLRVEKMGEDTAVLDYSNLKPMVIGVCYGDGIGPAICSAAESVLKRLLSTELASGEVVLKQIDGLTLENRLRHQKAIPDDVLAELKSCHVILKGPTTTPQAGSGVANIESANVAMRRELDLYANVRPVQVPKDGIDWIFFRENTEGEYVLGSRGFDVGPDLSVDFKIITQPGSERIIRMAFEYAKKNGKKRVTVVTKSNVVKTTDGRFSKTARAIATEYPEITLDEWYIDIMTAKLIDPARRHEFEVLVMPNLYGDILTDEAAQIQGGVGTAGSANIGTRYAMFEAIHGSAPRMVEEGRAQYADPSSIIKASAMLLRHVGFVQKAVQLEAALRDAVSDDSPVKLTGRDTGATAKEFVDFLFSRIG